MKGQGLTFVFEASGLQSCPAYKSIPFPYTPWPPALKSYSPSLFNQSTLQLTLTMPQSSCIFRSRWGAALSHLSAKSNYMKPVKDLVQWGDLPYGLYLPNDKSLAEVLESLRLGDPTAPDYVEDLRTTVSNLKDRHWQGDRLFECRWTSQSIQSATEKSLAQVFPDIDLRSIIDTFFLCVQREPTKTFSPDEFEDGLTVKHDKLLLETRGGSVGFAQRFQDLCSAKDCPDSRFRLGQLPIMGEDGSWKHVDDDDDAPSPIVPFTDTCISCRRAFTSGQPIFTTVHNGLPECLYADAHRKPYLCSEAGAGEEGYLERRSRD